MNCRWSTVRPGEACSRLAATTVEFCDTHLKEIVDEARARAAAARPPKTGILGKYWLAFVGAAVAAAGKHAFDVLHEIIATADQIEVVHRPDGAIDGAAIVSSDGTTTDLPQLLYDAQPDSDTTEHSGASVARDAPAPPYRDPDWLRAVAPHVRRMMIETMSARVESRYIAGTWFSSEIQYTPEQGLDRLSEEEIDGLLYHWGVPSVATSDAVDVRLREEKMLTLGGSLSAFGQAVAGRARLRRNLPIPARVGRPAGSP